MVQRLVGAEEMREEANYSHAVCQSFFLDGLNAGRSASLLHPQALAEDFQKGVAQPILAQEAHFFATYKFPNAKPYFQLKVSR